MCQIRGPTTAHHYHKTFIHKDLEDATCICVQVDRPSKPLESPYERSYKIIGRSSDFLYRIEYKGQPEEINIDRLKPAFIESAEISPSDTDDSHLSHQIYCQRKTTKMKNSIRDL